MHVGNQRANENHRQGRRNRRDRRSGRVEADRIKLTKQSSPEGHKDHHHYIDKKYVGAIEGDVVKLSMNADAIPKTEA